jgi:2Fe-2S ferredoxin
MPQLNVITRSGQKRTIEAQAGHTLKEALIAGGVGEINAITNCGGCCSCGTCHVFLDAADMKRVPPMRGQENDLLYIHDNRQPTSRLSCQIRVTDELDGLSVTIAPE